MRKKDFTSEFVQGEITEYIVNQDFPDELYDVGSRVFITDIVDVEIASVTKSESNFIVDGSATIEIEADLGEGDAASSHYPMKFSYEFDVDGKIVGQRRRFIDTSSFFAGNDDYETYLVEHSHHRASFESSVFANLSLLGEPISPPDKKCLHRLLFVNVVTVLECYLSDFFISRIREDDRLFRKLVETTPIFQQQKIAVSDVFKTMDAIKKRVDSHLLGLVWHRLDHVNGLYQRVLGVSFPSDTNALRSAIAVRHELVHRNGKKSDGTEHDIDETNIRLAIKAAEGLVNHIEDKWLEISSSSRRCGTASEGGSRAAT